MANIKITDMTQDTSPGLDSLIETTKDPGGSPLTRSASVADINMGLVLLKEVIASDEASIDVEDWYSSDYDVYHIELINIIPATEGVPLYLRMSTDGGITYDSGANYGSAIFYSRDGNTDNSLGVNSGDTKIVVSANGISSTVAHGGANGVLKLYNPGSTVYYKILNIALGVTHSTSSYLYRIDGVAKYSITSAVNAFQLIMSSGNISGTVRVYGMRK